MIKHIFICALTLAIAAGRPEGFRNQGTETTCPSDHSIHHLLPHEYDCTKFYYCEYGLKREDATDCAPGTEFSFELQVCVHPEQANCKLTGYPTEEETSQDQPTECPANNEYHLLLPHESDCGLFYQCDWGQKVLRECPEGTLFNNEIQVCDWPQNVNCANSDGTGDDSDSTDNGSESDSNSDNGNGSDDGSDSGNNNEDASNECPANNEYHLLLPHESDCGLFYQCDWGQKVLKECPEGTLFNNDLQVCDWPENVNCGNSDDTGDDSDSTDNGSESDSNSDSGNDDGEVDNGNSSDDGSDSGNNNEDASNECPANNEYHLLLPHESDCGLFYQCDWGQKVLKECPAGTLFNNDLQVCDWPENVNCGNSDDTGDDSNSTNNGSESDSDSTDNGSESDSNSDNGNGSDDGSDSGNNNEDASNECPANNEYHLLLPHESDCGLFYQCDWGQKVLKECPEGTLFNNDLQVCDWPQNVNCANSDDTGDDSDSTDNGSESDSDSTDNGSESDSNSDNGNGSDDGSDSGNNNEDASNECPANNEYHLLLPHESDCGLFYQCDWGQKVLKECPEGTLFNNDLQVCDWPENVNCGNSDDTGDDSDSTDNGSESDSDSTDNGSESDSNSDNGNGSDDDSDSGNNNEDASNECPANNEYHLLLPHESDCGLFYQCDWGQKVLKECPEGTLFNNDLQVCDWPENVNCGNSDDTGDDSDSTDNGSESDSGSTDNGSESDSTDNGSESDSNSDNGNGSDDGSDSGNNNEDASNECPANNEYHLLLPHESDCGLFYQCDWGQKVLRECPEGTLFNNEIQVCDWPQNVNCANSDSNGSDSDSTDNGSESDSDSTDNGSESDSNSDNGNGSDDGSDSGNNNENASNECPANNEYHLLLPHESDCGLFYQCDWGQKVLKECPEGTLFNNDLQVCDWPENVNCGNSDDTGDDSDSTNNGSESDSDSTDNGSESDSDSTDNGSESDSNSDNGNGSDDGSDSGNNNENASNECPANNEYHLLLPHESDCGLFYQCDWGQKVLKECPEGTLFNNDLQVCDWPENVNCGNSDDTGDDSDSTNNGSESDSDSTDNGSESDSDSTDNGSESDSNSDNGNGSDDGSDSGNNNENASNECPANNEYHLLLPHESDCGLFYQCDWGQKVLKECPAGTLFSNDLQVCDWPENVNCGNSDDTGDESDSTDNGSETDSTDNGSESDSNSDNGNGSDGSSDSGNNNEDASNECPANNEYHLLLPHESDCGLFYQCNWGQKVLKECPEGTLFNNDLQVCDWPENVNCGNSDDTGDDSDSTDNGSENDSDSTDNGSESDSNSDNGNGSDDGSDSGNNNEDASNECPANNEYHLLLPHESDCGLFYQCDWGQKVLKECPAGTLFNNDLQVCDWPENVNCGNSDDTGDDSDSTDNGSENDSDSTDNGSESDSNSDNGNGSDDGSDSGNNNEDASNECPANNEYHLLLPHESDCGLFYQCDWGQKVLKECPEGTLFNNDLQVCDWPENVNCGNSDDTGDDSDSDSTDNGSESDSDSTDNGSESDSNSDNGNGSDDGSDSGNNNEDASNECPANNEYHLLLPHESDCGLFYQCDWGQKVLKECPEGTLFNNDLQVCDWPENVNCGNSDDTGDDSDSTDNGSESDSDSTDNGSESDSDSTDNGSESDSNSDNGNGSDDGSDSGNNNEDASNECPANNEYHLLLPHESDCGLFYQCDWGQKVLRECPEGTLFNNEIQVCDWPQNVNCANSDSNGSDSDSTDNGSESDSDSTDNGSESDSNSDNGNGSDDGSDSVNNNEDASNECPANNEYHLLLPHESDCGLFYQCDWGQKVLKECPEGTLFNNDLQVCDWPENVNCGNSDDTGDDSDSTDNGSENDSDSTDNGSESDSDSTDNGSESDSDNGNGSDDGSDSGNNNEDASNECPANNEYHLLLPHESDCGLFYQCDWGQKVLKECPEGTLFNNDLQVCDWPENVNCGNSDDTGDDSDSTDNGSESDSDSTDNGSESDSDNGNGSDDSSDSGNNNEDASNECPANNEYHLLLPHESDCGLFYQCDWGQKVLRECPEGTLFNNDLQVCDWPWNVNCEESNDNENADNENANGNDNGSDNGNDDGNDDDVDSENDTEENRCSSCNSDRWVDPENCSRFYKCIGNQQVLDQCSNGLIFNNLRKICDYPHLVSDQDCVPCTDC